jgi:hypothetical protein
MFPNHATNGSFEDNLQLYGPSSPIIFPGSTDLAGWTIGANVTWHIGTALSNDASEGVAYVDLSAGGGSFGQMSQPLETIGGTEYKLSIDAKVDAPLVALNGTFITLTAEGTSDGWTTYTALFVAPTAMTTVAISSNSASVDNFSFVPQPQPTFPDFGADGGLHTDVNVFNNLNRYVQDGGYVFVTGHDAIAHPNDFQLIEFVGGTDAVAGQQVDPNYSTISAFGTAIDTVSNPISGGTPGTGAGFDRGGVNKVDGVREQDYLAMVAPGTTVLVRDNAVTGIVAAGWTVRHPYGDSHEVEEGQIAYIANGRFFYQTDQLDSSMMPTKETLSPGEDPSWLNDSNYKGALLNFAENSCGTFPLEESPIADSQTVTTVVDTPVVITLNGSDPDGQPITFTSNTSPSNGALSGGPSAGDPIPATVTYNPASGFTGNDSFSFIVEDPDGNTSLPGVVNIVVLEAAPAAVFSVDVGPDLFIDEGGVGDFMRSGSFDDPGGFTPHSAEVDYDDSAGFIGLTLTGNTFDLNHTYPTVDDGIFVVTVRVTNDFSEIASDSASIVINNVAPSVLAGADGAANAGVEFTRSGSFTDPGALDTWNVGSTVDYGDGGGPQPLSLNYDENGVADKTFDLSHTYLADGDPEDDVYTVTVVVTDDDGGMGSASFDVTVSENVEPARRQPTPAPIPTPAVTP